MRQTPDTKRLLARKVERVDEQEISTSEFRYRRPFEAAQDGILLLDAETGAVTPSLGVAVFPEHGATSTGILKAVDAALYRAKHEGRGRVVVAG